MSISPMNFPERLRSLEHAATPRPLDVPLAVPD